MTKNYDITVIGGGIAGAALAHSMSKAGAQVVVVPWGGAEAQALGLEVALQHADARNQENSAARSRGW